MRLSLIPIALAGLAIQQASAVPIRVVVVTTKQQLSPHNALDPLNPDMRVASLVRPIGHTTTVTQIGQPGAGRAKHICGGLAAKAKERSAAIAQMFREAFGFTSPHKDEDHVRFLPFIGTPAHLPQPVPTNSFWEPTPVVERYRQAVPVIHVKEVENGQGEKQRGSGRHHHHHHKGGFITRVSHALVSLGTWEGRVVAFVLGCGIGVLLRMFWVLSVVIVRSLSGPKEVTEALDNEAEPIYYDGVVIFDEREHDQPPQYAPPADATFPDEKKAASAADNSLQRPDQSL